MGLILRRRPHAPQPKTPNPIPENVVEQYLLLTNILQDAGLTPADQATCLTKYRAVFSPDSLNALAKSDPLFAGINTGVTSRLATDAQLAPLTGSGGADTKPEAENSALRRAKTVANAQLDMLYYPDLTHGEKGWITVLLHALAADLKASHSTDFKTAHPEAVVAQHPEAWIHRPDCAIWLGIMARLRVVLFSQGGWEGVSGEVREGYKRGWRGVFGLPLEEEGLVVGGGQWREGGERKMRWADVVKVGSGGALKAEEGVGTNTNTPATATTTGPFLTKSFFAQQTCHSTYLGWLKQEPGAAYEMQRELRKYLGLPLTFRGSSPKARTPWKGNGKKKQRSETKVGDDGWSRVDRKTT
ncbi:uncharacterized protein C8A04DRAFT_31730 [Dichotomopilus funicola]|uniref:Uncharacterized protein n=1 Tax=Dichotomopilus funicola TaxID=1934379 RepID=A0AAN6ZKC2_9PEZI|nr:hypothetical protein C8A04DRAFT_31730 [Dichotomopilus funicola]